MRLKRWESPRRQGRNDKGKGGSARQRQLRKRQQQLRQKLKEQAIQDSQASQQKPNNNQQKNQQKNQNHNKHKKREGSNVLLPYFFMGVKFGKIPSFHQLEKLR